MKMSFHLSCSLTAVLNSALCEKGKGGEGEKCLWDNLSGKKDNKCMPWLLQLLSTPGVTVWS